MIVFRNLKLKIRNYSLLAVVFTFSFLLFPSSADASAISRPGNNLGLTAYWSMEDATGTQITDFSGNGYTGTLADNATWTAGKRGKALTFDGTGDMVGVGDINLSSSSVTFAAWVKVNAFQTNSPYISSVMGEEINGIYQAMLRIGDAALANNKAQWVLFLGGAERKVDANTAIATSTWTHLAGTYDGSVMRLFVNGVEDASSSFSGDLAANTTFYLAHNSNRYLNGAIDEARVYRRALTAAEIAGLYNLGSARASASNNNGLLAYFSFEDATGTQVTDFSGNGNAGTLTGNAVSWVSSKRGKGLSFGGSDDYVNMGNVLDFERTDTRSFAFWINMAASPSAHNTILSKIGDASAYRGYDIGVRGDVSGDPIEFELRGASDSNWLTIRAAPPSWDGNWHHVVVTYAGTSAPSGVKIYFDGTLLSNTTDADTLASSINNAGSFVLGAFDETLLAVDLTGSLDELRIYNRVLDQTEVTALYGAPIIRSVAPNNLGLLGYWSMEDATGTQATDFSGNGHTGTLAGDTVWVTGKRGKALDFDGTGDYLSVATTSLLGLSTFTVCAWVKLDSPGGSFPNIFSTVTGPDGWDFYLYGNPFVVGTSFLTDAGYVFKEDGISSPTGQWTHVCAQQDGNSSANVKTFVNGVANSGSGSGTGTRLSDTSGNTIRIGDSGGGGFPFPGLIDEVRLYNRVLSTAEIAGLYYLGR